MDISACTIATLAQILQPNTTTLVWIFCLIRRLRIQTSCICVSLRGITDHMEASICVAVPALGYTHPNEEHCNVFVMCMKGI